MIEEESEEEFGPHKNDAIMLLESPDRIFLIIRSAIGMVQQKISENGEVHGPYSLDRLTGGSTDDAHRKAYHLNDDMTKSRSSSH